MINFENSYYCDCTVVMSLGLSLSGIRSKARGSFCWIVLFLNEVPFLSMGGKTIFGLPIADGDAPELTFIGTKGSGIF